MKQVLPGLLVGVQYLRFGDLALLNHLVESGCLRHIKTLDLSEVSGGIDGGDGGS